jgi:hypothetical protein
MSKSPLRKDKTCLNCRHVVEHRFCPNCGQENTDTRKTFEQLFVHFFEDLTHYENSFWKTIRNLIFKPASLTKEYLSGKRMSYLAPIRLYIFISFVTFFLFSILPDSSGEEVTNIKEANNHKSTEKIAAAPADTVTQSKKMLQEEEEEEEEEIKKLEQYGQINKETSDSLQQAAVVKNQRYIEGDFMNFGYRSIEELDSIQQYGKPEERLGDLAYWFHKKILLAKKGKTKDEVFDKLSEAFIHNIPKALFIYMPLFAFVLWLFQSKKRWYYFDHGIFTLHYFSFLLLASLILELFNFFMGLLGHHWLLDTIITIIDTVIIIYMLYYFFPAHHRFYQQSRLKTIIKGILIFFINMFILTFILIGLFFFSFINIH